MTTRRRKRHSPEQIVKKLRDAGSLEIDLTDDFLHLEGAAARARGHAAPDVQYLDGAALGLEIERELVGHLDAHADSRATDHMGEPAAEIAFQMDVAPVAAQLEARRAVRGSGGPRVDGHLGFLVPLDFDRPLFEVYPQGSARLCGHAFLKIGRAAPERSQAGNQ